MKDKDKISGIFRILIDEHIDSQSNNKPVSKTERDDINESWDAISFELDIDEVWTGISHKLDKIMPAGSDSGLILKFVAGILIVLSGISPVKNYFKDSGNLNPKTSALYPLYENSGEPASGNSGADRSSVEGPDSIINPVPTSLPPINGSSGISTDAEVSTNNLKDSIPVGKSQDADLTNLNIQGEISAEGSISGINNEEKEIADPEVSAVENPEKIKLSCLKEFAGPAKTEIVPASVFPLSSNGRGRFSGGYIAILKNTWLLNNETFDGLKSESLNTTEIVIFPDVGLSLIYSVNNRLFIQSDGFFYSNTGQKYFQYISGHYSRKKIILRYSTIALSAKYKFIVNRGLIPCSSINLIAGGYLSALHHADQKINSDLEHIGSQYRGYDLGVRLGSEIELPLNYYFSLAPGIFVSYGIPNIYKGDSYIPGYLRKTHNGNAEFHLSFYYNFY